MNPQELKEMLLQKRKQLIRLNEVEDLSKQLGQALDRRDEVSVKMLIAMRQEPILRLEEIEGEIRGRLESVPEETAIRLAELLNGAEPETPEEDALSTQVDKNRRLLERIVSLDKLISARVGGRYSFYSTFR